MAARFLGVGTDNVFGSLGHDGRLGPLTGPFEGQRLNPMADAVPPAPPPRRRGRPKRLEPPAVIIAGGQAVPEGTTTFIAEPARDPPASSPSRPARKTFVADKSLSRKKHL